MIVAKLTAVKFFSFINNRGFAMKIGIIGVPFRKGQKIKGVEKAPSLIRKSGLLKKIEKLGLDVKDYGNVSYESNNVDNENNISKIQCLPHFASCCYKLSSLAQQIIQDERLLITIGGDHSIALGSVQGHIEASKKPVSILWIDAHADINLPNTSLTGNLHGMPVALLAKELTLYRPNLPGFEWHKPKFSLKDLAYIGLRCVDPHERLILQKYGIPVFGMEEIEKLGIHQVITMALEKINPFSHNAIHISFDIDALNPLEAPSTGTPVRGGLTLREAIHIIETTVKTGNLRGFDLVEINPSIGNQTDVELTIEAGMNLLLACCGYQRTGSLPNDVTDLPRFYV